VANGIEVCVVMVVCQAILLCGTERVGSYQLRSNCNGPSEIRTRKESVRKKSRQTVCKCEVNVNVAWHKRLTTPSPNKDGGKNKDGGCNANGMIVIDWTR
jgi:hypothetical protein